MNRQNRIDMHVVANHQTVSGKARQGKAGYNATRILHLFPQGHNKPPPATNHHPEIPNRPTPIYHSSSLAPQKTPTHPLINQSINQLITRTNRTGANPAAFSPAQLISSHLIS
jgi:hypothetical protein